MLEFVGGSGSLSELSFSSLKFCKMLLCTFALKVKLAGFNHVIAFVGVEIIKYFTLIDTPVKKIVQIYED